LWVRVPGKEEIMSPRKSVERSVRRSRQWSSLVCAASLESLETRRLLASIVVNTTLDETIANSTISLREAVAQAQANAGDLTITAGRDSSQGGAILNAGTLALSNDVTLSENNVIAALGPNGSGSSPGVNGGNADGGAIYSTGTLGMANSSITLNSATAGNG